MPTYTRGQLRDQLTFVKVTSLNIFYGFSTKDYASLAGAGLSTGDLQTLGHTASGALPESAIKIIAANSPKPPRARKIINPRPTAQQQRAISTFIGIDSINAAETLGFRLVNSGRGVTLTNNERTKTVGADLRTGGLYLFPMNAVDANQYASQLGLQLPEQISAGERDRAFSGASRPRPAKIKLDLGAGGSFSSFCSYDALNNALSSGFQLVTPEVIY